jgi:hypothetical protein
MLLNKQRLNLIILIIGPGSFTRRRDLQVLLLSHLRNLAMIKYTILANRAIPFSAMAIVEITPLKGMMILKPIILVST